MNATLLYDGKCALGEGVLWHDKLQTVFWVDIEGRSLHALDYRNKAHQSWEFDKRVTNIVLDVKGELILGFQGGLGRFDVKNGVLEWLVDIEPELPAHRCNDGSCDPAGRLWIGTMHTAEVAKVAGLYCVHPDLKVEKKLSGISISNGIVWSPDHRRMYYIDTPTSSVQSFLYRKETAGIIFERIVVKAPEDTGMPDGMAIDREGMLWICHWGGYGVYRWDPGTGELMDKIELPAPNVTSCAFGGADLSTLFITTAREGLTPEEIARYPLSGGLFEVQLPIGGILPYPFAG